MSDNRGQWDHSDEDEEPESSQAKNREGETTPQTSFKEHEHVDETRNAPSQPKVSYSQVVSTPPRSPYSDTSSVTTRPLKILTYNNGKVTYGQREDVLSFENIYESKEVMQGAREATRLASEDLKAYSGHPKSKHGATFLTEGEHTVHNIFGFLSAQEVVDCAWGN